MAIGANMIKVSCSFCGRKPDNEKFDSDFWPLYTRNIDSYSNVCICNACKRVHPDAYDFYFSEKEEEPMKVKVKRDSKEEIEVDVNDLQYNDEFDISKDGEVIATGIVTDTWESNGACKVDVIISFKKEGKIWKDLGYDCFEDMIDDIAKRHREGEEQKDDKIDMLKTMINSIYGAKGLNAMSGIYEKSDAMEAIYGLDKHQAAEFVALLSAEVGIYGEIDKIAILNSLKKVRGRGLYD